MTSHRVVVEPLGVGPSAEELARRAAHLPGLVCLRGRFAGGSPVLTSHPVRRLPVGEVPADGPVDAVVPYGHVDAVVAGDPGRDAVAGGWFGVAGFDAASTRFAFHDHVVRLVDGRWRFEALWTPERAGELAARRDAWSALIAAPTGEPAPGFAVDDVVAPSHEEHLRAVERAVELIRAGELYQVNVCTRFTARFRGSPAALFAAAATRLDPAFGALLVGPERAVVSVSPELSWRRRGREITSAPIKGTRPLGPGHAAGLRGSTKDAAENVMIVDLVRNDLGRVCETGTVRPTALLQVVEHVGVLHLVSEVAGRLRADAGDAEVHAALFPPGSVTGTPKPRALQVIGELEARPRGAYTGALGFVSPVWGAEFAVAIRTFELDGEALELGVGGGVTVDSVPEVEWRECLAKAAPLLRAVGVPPRTSRPGAAAPSSVDRRAGVFETLLAVDGHLLRAADHLARLDRSARELFGAGVPDTVAGRVQDVVGSAGPGRVAVRVVLAADGTVSVTAAPARPAPTGSAAVVTGRADGVWRHKWADRTWAVDAERSAGHAVPLFVAADGTVLETSRGNVVLVAEDGRLITAPLRDDLLPGVTRRALLDHARDSGRGCELRSFDLAELRRRPAFWTSSLSGAVPITALDGVPTPRDDDAVAALAAVLGQGGAG